MGRRVRKQFHVEPTFDSVEQEYGEEKFKDPGPGLARQATEFVLNQDARPRILTMNMS